MAEVGTCELVLELPGGIGKGQQKGREEAQGLTLVTTDSRDADSTGSENTC